MPRPAPDGNGYPRPVDGKHATRTNRRAAREADPTTTGRGRSARVAVSHDGGETVTVIDA